ncbi:MAG: hypothetical protein H0V29_00490, partial [Thermoleophilaceae bacterium]|nr:hypothetical protein [Thermoleophilaceae bacterium]
TWSPRRLVAAAFRRLAERWPVALGGLMPLDPADELRAAGFSVTRRVELPHSGYPSLVLAAERR